jgi:putative holliday junction resolvase
MYHIMKNMRVMALDVGDKKIGVAISDELLLTAQGRPTLRRKNLRSDLEVLRRLAMENDVQVVVIGQPLHMDGTPSAQTDRVARFSEELRKVLDVPFVFWDERLTSFEAEQHLEQMGMNWRQRREHVDKVAAMIILQNYLDSRAGHPV